MSKIWLVLTMVFLFFSACNTQNKSRNFDWKEFISEEGKFKATFPAIPIKSATKGGKDDQIPIDKYEVFFDEPFIYFGVWCKDFPAKSSMTQDEFKTEYDDIQNRMLKDKAELVSSRDIWINGKLGRELVYKSGILTTKYRVYSIGNRGYELITSTKSSLLEDTDVEISVDKFLDSFQPIDK